MSNSILARLALMSMLDSMGDSDKNIPEQECPCERCTLERVTDLPSLMEYLTSDTRKDSQTQPDVNLRANNETKNKYSFIQEHIRPERPDLHLHTGVTSLADAPSRYPKFKRVAEETLDTQRYNVLNTKLNRALSLGNTLNQNVNELKLGLKRIEAALLDISGKQSDTDETVNNIRQLLEYSDMDAVSCDDDKVAVVEETEDEYITVDLRRKDRSVNPDEPRLPQFYVEEVVNDQGTILPIRRLIKPKKTNKELKMFLEMLMNLSYQSYGTEFAVSEDIHKKITDRNTSHTIKGTPQRVLITNSDEGVYVIVHDVNTYEVTNVFAQSSSGPDVKFRKLAILPETIKTFGKIPTSLK